MSKLFLKGILIFHRESVWDFGKCRLFNKSLPSTLHFPDSHESEDSRLFRILNRLNNDSDRERQIIALRQLKEFFLNPDNAKVRFISYHAWKPYRFPMISIITI